MWAKLTHFMRKKFFLGLLAAFLFIFFSLNKPAEAQENKILMAGYSAVLKSQTSNPEKDQRKEKLKAFLESYNSPLSEFAEEFIQAADKYQIDWRLLPAITGVESSFGKEIPYQSFNAYGWNNGNYYFKSWEESIYQVSKALREKYFNRGLDTPEKIGPVYAPPSPSWGRKVNNFMVKIESFQLENSLHFLILTL